MRQRRLTLNSVKVPMVELSFEILQRAVDID